MIHVRQRLRSAVPDLIGLIFGPLALWVVYALPPSLDAQERASRSLFGIFIFAGVLALAAILMALPVYLGALLGTRIVRGQVAWNSREVRAYLLSGLIAVVSGLAIGALVAWVDFRRTTLVEKTIAASFGFWLYYVYGFVPVGLPGLRFLANLFFGRDKPVPTPSATP